LSPERARDPTKSPLNDSRDIRYNFSGIVVPPPPPPLEKTIRNFVQERKTDRQTDRQTDSKKPQRFLILQQLLDFHQIVFSLKKINNNNHHLGSSKPQFFANFTQTRQSTGSSSSCRPQTDRCTTGIFFCSRLAAYKNIKLGQISSAFPSSTAK
jgi:hypothetical protein